MAAFWTELLSRIAKRQGDAGDTFPVDVVSGSIETTNSSTGNKEDEAVTDPQLSASEIALLKGILKQMQYLFSCLSVKKTHL